MAEVVSADVASAHRSTKTGETYQGDFLVLAAGSQANSSAHPAPKVQLPLYSLHDAELLRSRILAVMEAADRDPSLVAKGALNFVLVGAGPTGAEMSGTLGDMLHRALKEEYPNLPLNEARIYVVDMGHCVLGAFSPKAQAYAAKMLAERGVKSTWARQSRKSGMGMCCSPTEAEFPPTPSSGPGPARLELSANLGLRPGHGGRIDVQSDLTVGAFPRCTRWGISPTSSAGWQAAAATGVGRRTGRQMVRQEISQPKSPASPESPSTTSTKASWR